MQLIGSAGGKDLVTDTTLKAAFISAPGTTPRGLDTTYSHVQAERMQQRTVHFPHIKYPKKKYL